VDAHHTAEEGIHTWQSMVGSYKYSSELSTHIHKWVTKPQYHLYTFLNDIINMYLKSGVFFKILYVIKTILNRLFICKKLLKMIEFYKKLWLFD
jgi:hypothetical protein